MWGNHSSHHFLLARAPRRPPSSTRSCRPKYFSLSPARCRLGPFTGTHCAAPSVRRASHLPIRQRCSSRCPASGQLEEVMWGCRRERCVTITVHVPTPCRCSLLAASDPLSRSLTASSLAASLKTVVGATQCGIYVIHSRAKSFSEVLRLRLTAPGPACRAAYVLCATPSIDSRLILDTNIENIYWSRKGSTGKH